MPRIALIVVNTPRDCPHRITKTSHFEPCRCRHPNRTTDACESSVTFVNCPLAVWG